jgi:hypothetical protein
MLTTHMIGICGVALSAFVFLAILGSEYAAKWISAPVHKHRSGSMYDSRPEDWTYIGTTGGIESYLRKVEGSNLLAFRGVAYLDMHISQAMGPYINISTARQWVSMLKHIQQLAVQDSNTAKTKKDFDAEDLVYQVRFHSRGCYSTHRSMRSNGLSSITLGAGPALASLAEGRAAASKVLLYSRRANRGDSVPKRGRRAHSEGPRRDPRQLTSFDVALP